MVLLLLKKRAYAFVEDSNGRTALYRVTWGEGKKLRRCGYKIAVQL
jgi:hypothetical protein